MPTTEHSDSAYIEATPEAVYALVADITRMGEYSPVCTACWWDDEAAAKRSGAVAVGDWFTGRNELPDRTWETRSQVVAAEPGREFAFAVGGTNVRWGYRFDAEGSGTRVTESWQVPPAGVAWFAERFGDDADAQLEVRYELARTGIPVTLAAIKAAAEA